MKRIILVTLLCMTGLPEEVCAQLQKGTKHWAGTVNLTGIHTRQKDFPGSPSGNSYFAIYPSVQAGWFTRDNRMIGVGLGSSFYFLHSKSELASQTYRAGLNNLSLSLSPFYPPLQIPEPEMGLIFALQCESLLPEDNQFPGLRQRF